MGYKIFIFLWILTSHSSLAQVDFKIEDLRKNNSTIKLDLEIRNTTNKDFILKKYQRKMDVVDYYTLEGADSLNYEGMSFLVSNGKEYVKIDYFPIELKHRSKFSNWLDFLFLKAYNIFSSNELKVHGNSTKNKSIKIDLNGLQLSEGEFFIQIVYHLPSTDRFIGSNMMLFQHQVP